MDRRKFLKSASIASIASALGCSKKEPTQPEQQNGNSKPEFASVPKRKFGRTDIHLPALWLGCNRLDNQVILRSALKWGVNCWDTSHSYMGGDSELNIGRFFEKSPELRKDIFIVSKASKANSIEQVQQRLETSFQRMNTDYIDLYYGVHGLSDPSQLTDKLQKWTEQAKQKGQIRYFGFSIHKNMAKCLFAAAKHKWIDAIMTSYNFRLMQDTQMTDAVQACHEAGIAVVAMKTTGTRTDDKIESDADKKLTDHFLQRGFTEVQAKIKAVLADQRVTSACVGMNNVATLTENALATLDRTHLNKEDVAILDRNAAVTARGYCAGCANLCETEDTPCISDAMRCLMYYNGYRDEALAIENFRLIPKIARKKLETADFTNAQQACPHNLNISDLIKETLNKLA